MKVIVSKSPKETKELARKLAKKQKEIKTRKNALVVGLIGELGAGKTAFVQGFARGLGIKGKIVSPTFILMRKHGNFYHFDAYRINKPKEILDLGWREIVSNPGNIIIIEWADKIKKILPKKYIKINFQHVDENKRKISIAR